MPWLGCSKSGGILLSLHVQPGARRTSLAGVHGERLKVAVASPPVDGKANKAVCKFLARLLGCAVRDLEVVSGHGCRQKLVALAGMTEDEVRQKVTQALATV